MKNLKIFIILLISFEVFSEDLEIFYSFGFNNPYLFYEHWDQIEGTPPGFSRLLFTNNDLLMLGSRNPFSWDLYYSSNTGLIFMSSVEFDTDLFSGLATQFSDGFILYSLRTNGYIKIYFYSDISNIGYSLPFPTDIGRGERVSRQNPPVMISNYMFLLTTGGNLISWELFAGGEYLFRNIEQTNELLSSETGIMLGYNKGPFGDGNYFGEFSLNRQIDFYYEYIGDELIFTEEAFEGLDSLESFSAIGYDSNGINYYYSLYPEPCNLNIDKIKDGESQLVIAILDTWTQKVYFKVLSHESWTPPIRVSYDGYAEFIGTYPNTVHPNGDIYFVDADLELQEYQLKRLENDWYPEMGIDEREILRIDGNHIPLRLEPESPQNNGYNFENEFVWVQEHQGEWLRVRKIDGREGWILESETYDEGY